MDEEGQKIRRSVSKPLPELTEGLQEDSIKRTVYCKGFPKDGSVTLDDLLEYFKTHGEYDSVRVSIVSLLLYVECRGGSINWHPH